MDAKGYADHSPDKNSICSLEWIVSAIDAARRVKKDEHREPPARPRRGLTLVKIDCSRR